MALIKAVAIGLLAAAAFYVVVVFVLPVLLFAGVALIVGLIAYAVLRDNTRPKDWPRF